MGFNSAFKGLKEPGNYDGQSTWHASETCYSVERNLCVKKFLVTRLMFLIKSLYKCLKISLHFTKHRNV